MVIYKKSPPKKLPRKDQSKPKRRRSERIFRKRDAPPLHWDPFSACGASLRRPSAWASPFLGLAPTRPLPVPPHERGHVVELVRSKRAAPRFAYPPPAPSAEW